MREIRRWGDGANADIRGRGYQGAGHWGIRRLGKETFLT